MMIRCRGIRTELLQIKEKNMVDTPCSLEVNRTTPTDWTQLLSASEDEEEEEEDDDEEEGVEEESDEEHGFSDATTEEFCAVELQDDTKKEKQVCTVGWFNFDIFHIFNKYIFVVTK
jgi:hypothetical protein